MSSGDGEAEGTRKSEGDMSDPPPRHPQPYPYQFQYGTFGAPGVSQPVIGIPQPVGPPGIGAAPAAPPSYPPYSAGAFCFAHGYQTIPVYTAGAEISPLRLKFDRPDRLPCCGLGLGWFMFFAGFFLAAIPWYMGAFILLCVRIDYREKPGLVACTLAAILFAVAVFLGAKQETFAR